MPNARNVTVVSHIDCPGGATMTISYYQPRSQQEAEADCNAIPGAVWTPD